MEGTVHKLTYSELDRAANRLARAILSRTRTQGKGDYVVAVSHPPSDALLLTLLAVWKVSQYLNIYCRLNCFLFVNP